MQKKIIVIIATIILILVLNHPGNQKDSQNQYNTQDNTQNQYQDSKNEYQDSQNYQETSQQDCRPQFTEYLIDPKYVQKLGQVGVVHGSGTNIIERSYISIKKEFYEQDIPIYAPTDMTLTAGSHYNNPAAPPNLLSDYALKFDAGCNVEVMLGHIKKVVDSIGNQLIEAKPDSRDSPLTPIKFKAGELIGYYVQQSEQGAVAGFDFIVRDPKFINTFINQERYSDDRAINLINGVCPYDYYTEDKKETYYNLLGGAGGTIFKVKDCGTASRDKAGTISGMWFLTKEIKSSIYDDVYKEGNYGNPLSIVGDEESITIGNLGQTATLRVYSQDPTYRLATEITDEHCYQFYENPSTKKGYAYFKVIDKETMDLSFSSTGECPSSMPKEAKRYYK